jgi:hypothetical protein
MLPSNVGHGVCTVSREIFTGLRNRAHAGTFRLMKQTGTYRRLLAGIVFASIGLVFAVSGCGSSSETSRPNGARTLVR